MAEERDGGRDQPTLVSGLHLAALWALAVAQPQLDLLRDGEIFVLAGWSGAEIAIYSFALIAAPPALMVAAEWLAGLAGRGARRGLHLVFVGGLTAILAGYAIKTIQPSALRIFLLAPVIGAGVALAYTRLAPVRSFFSFLAPAPLLVLGLFLLASPVTPLVFHRDAQAGPVGPPRDVPIVVIVFDELPTISLMDRRGEIDARSYPSLAALSRDATWFRNATTVHDFSHGASPAILTGTYAADGDPASARAYPDNLFTLLRDSHRLAVYEELRICPEEACPESAPRSFPERVTALLPALAKATAHTFAPNAAIVRLPVVKPFEPAPRTRGFDRLDADIVAEGKPVLFYVHPFLPHSPWEYLPSGKRYPRKGCCIEDRLPELEFIPQLGLPAFGDDRLTEHPGIARRTQQAHLAQMRFTDRLLGRVLDRLRAEGLYDRALIIVTADHGIGFQPGENQRRLTRANAAEILNVPLLVKLPFQRRGRVDDRFVQTIDIVPTIADALDIELPWETDGRSVLDPDADRARLRATRTLEGEEFAIDARDLRRERDRLVRETDAAFGKKVGIRIFALGPHRALVGRRVRALSAKPREDAGFVLDVEQELESVDPHSELVPAAISGRVVGKGAPKVREIAVALNGRIVASTTTYPSVEGVRFDALVPESAFRAGRNTVQVLEAPSGNARRLRLVPRLG